MNTLTIFKILFFVTEFIISAVLIEQLYQYFMERLTTAFIKREIEHTTFVKKSKAVFSIMAVIFFTIQLFFINLLINLPKF